MLNKRGMTLVELLLSLSLVSIVVLLMYNLILRINQMRDNAGFAINNQTNRLEIIKTIENDLIDHRPVDVIKENNKIIFEYANGFISTIEFFNEDNRDYIVYIPYADENYKSKWLMKNASINYEGIIACSSGNAFKLTIMILTPEEFNNKIYNNSLDDIEISYVFNHDLDFDNCK